MSIIRVLDYDLLEESGTEAPSSPGQLRREHWAALHDAVSEVLRLYGTVGNSEGVHFYHSGDWFDEHVDAFTLMSGAEISVRCLDELREALMRHDPAATLILEADAMKLTLVESEHALQRRDSVSIPIQASLARGH